MNCICLKNILRMISLSDFAFCVGMAVRGFQSGVFASQQAMEEIVAACGSAGAVLFVLLQSSETGRKGINNEILSV